MKQVKKAIVVKNNVPEVKPAQTNISKLVSQIDNSPNRNQLRLFLALFGKPSI